MKLIIISAFLLVFAFVGVQILTSAQSEQIEGFKYPDVSKGRGTGARGAEYTGKLSPELRILYSQYRNGARGAADEDPSMAFNGSELKDVFGINANEGNPTVDLAVTLEREIDIEDLKKLGMKVYMRNGNTVYGEASVLILEKIAADKNVIKISATKAAKSPELPLQKTSPILMKDLNFEGSRGGAVTKPLANEFNKGNLTGKGVIIGIIDSGIDWKHPDFIKPDGTSRIIAIWDYFDESFKTSNGKIGSEPPKLDPKGDPLGGTVYTNAQINAALEENGTINSADNNGHGTAVAGTAAGNGTVSKGKYAGVAPEADLLIFKTVDCDRSSADFLYGAYWMATKAKSLKKPLVVNISFSSHFSTHDGKDEVEKYLNYLSQKDKVIFTVSAGNEAQYNLHAAGRFGPKRKDQQDIDSKPVRVTISQERTDGAMLIGLFDPKDEWGVVVNAATTTKLVDKDGKPLSFYVFKHNKEIKYLLGDGQNKPDWFDEFARKVISGSQIGETKDFLILKLPPGTYNLIGFGATEKVVNGNFDFYTQDFSIVDFGRGTVKSEMIGSPGGAADVITVGAYNFRPNWLNKEGTNTKFNLPVGDISDYSSPGGKRLSDGVIKPDITAPGTFTISPLSQTAGIKSEACGGKNMGAEAGTRYITESGHYISWQGTSASAPFTAGVIALMLQKNRTLDARQVRNIFTKTAKKGGMIGAVPNPFWGYGMLDPAAAIRATPLARVRRKR